MEGVGAQPQHVQIRSGSIHVNDGRRSADSLVRSRSLGSEYAPPRLGRQQVLEFSELAGRRLELAADKNVPRSDPQFNWPATSGGGPQLFYPSASLRRRPAPPPVQAASCVTKCASFCFRKFA